MPIKFITFLIALTLIFACNNPAEEKTPEENKTDSTKVNESIRNNMSFLNDYNALEEVFGNENWLMAAKKDSSYLYVSRLGDFKVNTYAYRLQKGDSANVLHGAMKTEGNQIIWEFDKQPLFITSATRGRVVWSVVGADSLKYEFMRVDGNHISLTYPDKKKMILKKTLPLSLFLIRSQYDYAHGTHLAFDSTQLNKRNPV